METADTDRSNNFWPPKMEPSKFELYKYKNRRSRPSDNPMKKRNRAAETLITQSLNSSLKFQF